jgi:hypothetical protein
MDILILNIIIWIWKLIVQFWIFFINFKKIIWSKNWYLNSELLFWNLKLYFNWKNYLLSFKGFLY